MAKISGYIPIPGNIPISGCAPDVGAYIFGYTPLSGNISMPTQALHSFAVQWRPQFAPSLAMGKHKKQPEDKGRYFSCKLHFFLASFQDKLDLVEHYQCGLAREHCDKSPLQLARLHCLESRTPFQGLCCWCHTATYTTWLPLPNGKCRTLPISELVRTWWDADGEKLNEMDRNNLVLNPPTPVPAKAPVPTAPTASPAVHPPEDRAGGCDPDGDRRG